MARRLAAQDALDVQAGCAKVLARRSVALRLIELSLPERIATLAEGDTLVVCKLDRLARSTRDLLNTLAAIAEAGATFKSLSDPWADTPQPHGQLMLTVLGGLAEFERHLILARTNGGPHTSPG